MPEQSGLRIMTINLGRCLEERQRDFPRRLGNDLPLPDVLLVQDLPFREIGRFERFPFMTFAPMTNHFVNDERAVVGIAILSRFFLTRISHHTYWGDGVLKNLEGVKNNKRYLAEESDRLVEKTEDRVLICASVRKDGVEYDLATTHGMWTRRRIVNDVQRVSMRKLRDQLQEEAGARGGLVLAGDLNTARGDEVYRMLCERCADQTPETIRTTLDPDHQVSKLGIQIVVDYVMTVPDARSAQPYTIWHVKSWSGVSDHCAISALVAKR